MLITLLFNLIIYSFEYNLLSFIWSSLSVQNFVIRKDYYSLRISCFDHMNKFKLIDLFSRLNFKLIYNFSRWVK